LSVHLPFPPCSHPLQHPSSRLALPHSFIVLSLLLIYNSNLTFNNIYIYIYIN
jgi:hypothetical protein